MIVTDSSYNANLTKRAQEMMETLGFTQTSDGGETLQIEDFNINGGRSVSTENTQSMVMSETLREAAVLRDGSIEIQ